MNGDRAGSLEIRLEVLTLLEPNGDSEELAGAYRTLGAYHMLGSAYAESIAWSERALEVAARVGAEQVAVEARNDLGVSLAVGGDDVARGLGPLRECVATATDRGWMRQAGRAYVNLSDALMRLGRLEEASVVAREGLAPGFSSRTQIARWVAEQSAET
jgi:hypothetical protein